ncbi:hypothetical protein [Actinomadura sp. 3N407]|uniref:hypothetical protein n=1 Tax=Actinomadura sp. 3N407 TaxID=3457423 RepID=UPI003FCE53BA
MSNVSEPASPSDAEIAALLELLRADYDGWHFQYSAEVVSLPWEAMRGPMRFPPGGGVAWMRAVSMERLRTLLDALAEIESP